MPSSLFQKLRPSRAADGVMCKNVGVSMSYTLVSAKNIGKIKSALAEMQILQEDVYAYNAR